MPFSSGKSSLIGRGIRLCSIIAGLGVAVVMFGQARPAQAEPYLRVCKKGVIYYYFSDRYTWTPPPSLKRTPPGRRTAVPSRRLSPQELEPLIQEAGRKHNVPPSLIKAVIRVESNFNAAATSPKGAQGLMQLMPGTAEDLRVADAYDPRENVSGGVRYLRMLLEKFNFQLPLALAAYNAGPQRVSQRQQVPAIPETQGFVQNVCTEFVKFSKEQAPPKSPAGEAPPASAHQK